MPRAGMLLMLLFAGCVAPAAPAPSVTFELPREEVPCDICYEPVLAAFPDLLVLDDWSHAWTLFHPNGTTRAQQPPGPDLGDSTVHAEPFLLGGDAEEEALYALLAHDGVGVDDEIRNGEHASVLYVYRGLARPVEVARIEPGATSGWPYVGGDRPWIARSGERAVVSWMVPQTSDVELAFSEDGGRTWETHAVSRATGPSSPRPALSPEGRLLFPVLAASTTFTAAREVPAYLDVRTSDDGGATWTTRDGPALLADAPPRGEGFWTGSAWSDELGFLLAWGTDGGRVVLASSTDGLSWSSPRAVLALGSPATHPWIEPYGRCVTLSTWTHDGLNGDARLHFAVALDDQVVLDETLVELELRPTDFAQHVVLDDAAYLAWPGAIGHAVRRIPLEGLGC